MSDLYPQASVPRKLVDQRSPFIQLAGRSQNQPTATPEEAAEEPGQSRCRMGRCWWGIGDEVMSPRRGGCGIPHPGIVALPSRRSKAPPNGALVLKALKWAPGVSLRPTPRVAIPRGSQTFPP